MGKLLIFIDETGTPPLNNEKNIFAVAGLGVFDNYPAFIEKNGRKSWLIAQLIKHSAIPFISFIEPDPEYYNKINKKLDIIEKMAVVTLETTGKNKKYFSSYGLERRNIIWITLVNNCISQIILNAVMKDSIDELTIYLDQKTLHPTSLDLFNNQIDEEQRCFIGSLQKVENVPQSFLAHIKSGLNWEKDNIKVIWSNDHRALPATFGLELAHYLGHYFCKDYNKINSDSRLQNCLINAEYLSHSNKINSFLIKEIDKKAIQDWEKNTGLKFEESDI